MFGSFNGFTAMLCALLSLLILSTTSAEIVNLGRPCRAKNVLSGRIVTDRATGRELLVMVDMNETNGAELLFVDFEKNTGWKVPCPGGNGAWALNEVPGDRLVIGTFYDGKFMVFDLKKMEFVKDVSFPGESYIWNLALGNDGRIYGGSYGSGKLGALDLNTYEVEDLGNPAPPNLYCRNVSSLPDGRILCNWSTEKPTNLIFDPATKKFEPTPKQLGSISTGVTWHGYFLSGDKAFKGGTLEEVKPPFPTPPAKDGKWFVATYGTTDDYLILHQGNRVFTYKYGDKDLKLVADMGPNSGRIFGANKKGELLGLRGQDYFILKPGDKQLYLRRIPVESGPRPTHFLRCDDSGVLWGGTNFGQTLFHMDPKTGKYKNTGIICNAGGEAYDVAFKNGKTYAVTYVGGDIVEYDPAKPWDQLNNKNPRVITYVGRDRGFIRPIAGVQLGADGKLYSGWMAAYGTYGGAIAITDPDTGDTKLIKNPLGKQAICGIAMDGKYIYAGTSLAGNGLPNQKGESAKFGIVDPATEKVLFEKSFEGMGSLRVLAYDDQSKRVAFMVASTPQYFDTEKREFVQFAKSTPEFTCHSYGYRDGILYYGSEKSIVKLDIRTGEHTQIAETKDSVANVALGPNGAVYFSSGADVYALK